ncbi:MAG TPA: hypothetical protein PK286_05150 [Devosia sp.]|nr:hypothetical protein [Devosia sp.]
MPRLEPERLAGISGPDDRRLGDAFVERLLPSPFYDPAGYEEALIRGLRQFVRANDRVTVVGGGAGVTAAIAAQLAGPTGRVICFEGTAKCASDVRKTAERNKVEVDVRDAVVGVALHVYGKAADKLVAPLDLPECDVLELDCEGAELMILGGMSLRPRHILVETHGFYGAPTKAVHEALEGLGYDVEDLGLAEPRQHTTCERRDIRVLAATRR